MRQDRVVEQVKEGRLHFLLVSPEAVAGGGGIFGSLIQVTKEPNLDTVFEKAII